MGKNKPAKLSPAEAVRLARSLGWTAEPKKASGDYLFIAPDGKRYTSRAPGRADRVPLVLSKALHATRASNEEKGTST